MENDIEKILERLNYLETAIHDLKGELQELKEQTDDFQDESAKDSIKKAFEVFNDIFGIARELKRQMRRTFRSSRRRRPYYEHDNDFSFDFDFDFGHLGDFINDTVQNALSGLENLSESWGEENFPRMAKVRVQPGVNLRFDQEAHSEVIPTITDISHGKELLTTLENKIASFDDLLVSTSLNADELTQALAQLKEKYLVIQEKHGQQRFLLTKLGKKVLKGTNEQKNGEQTNN